MSTKPKILVVLGPTATGKSDLAVLLAKKYNGEVISADSRQVYKGLNIGSGKITKKEMRGVPHHLLDVISPRTRFSVDAWKRKTEQKIKDIVSHGKLPIICGGTGFYIQSIVDDIILPHVPPNKKLRNELEKKDAQSLFTILQKLDPERAQTIEQHNPVRLVRAIEIATALGAVPPLNKMTRGALATYEFLQIGLTLPDTQLKERIIKRLDARLKKGMLREAQKLHDNGLSWKRMFELGLEYRYESLLLQHKISKQDFVEKLNTEIWHYAKRQMTWFKRDKNIKWFAPTDTHEIEICISHFLDSKTVSEYK